ncbi:MAG: hypoxanthine phosphoribosyltransferase [Ruminococcus sp.]|nr:hypoxanthine phosphoribosyltransferase [Ruminococcus sp.]
MDKISLLISENDIKKRVAELGAQISQDFKGQTITVVSVLKGAVVFTSDLIRSIDCPIDLNFIRAKSYIGMHSNNNVDTPDNPEFDVKGKNILIVEDIIDTGNTLFKLKNLFYEKGCNDVKIAVFLDKDVKRNADVSTDYTCFNIDDKFVVGYGLDYDEKYRQLPYLGVLTLE